MTGRLLVVGDVVTDIVAVPAAPPAPDTDTTAAIRTRPGGSGANTAAWAAHSGAKVRMLGRVGADSADWHRDHLTEHGVDSRLRVDPTRPTAVVIAVIAPDGERGMLTDRGAGAELGLDDWDDALLSDVEHLHMSGYLWFADPGARLGTELSTIAGKRGITTSVDPASTGFLREYGIDRFLAGTAGVDFLFPNAAEACLLAGESDVEAAAVALSRRYSLVAVTLGADGALLVEKGAEPVWCPASSATVVDLVGAGDAFTGAFLAARLSGADSPTAVRLACEAGAAAVGNPGGRP